MAISPNDLGKGTLSSAGSTIASCTKVEVKRITHAVFYNKHTSVVTVTVYYLRDGQTISSNGSVKVKKKIPPGQSWFGQGVVGQHIANNASLFAVPSVDAVIDYNISGDIIT